MESPNKSEKPRFSTQSCFTPYQFSPIICDPFYWGFPWNGIPDSSIWEQYKVLLARHRSAESTCIDPARKERETSLHKCLSRIGLRSGFLDSQHAAFSCMGLKIDDLDNVRCKYAFYTRCIPDSSESELSILHSSWSSWYFAFWIPVGPVRILHFAFHLVQVHFAFWIPGGILHFEFQLVQVHFKFCILHST